MKENQAEDLLLILEGHESSAQAMGREYLRRVPTEVDEKILVFLVCTEQGEPPRTARGPQATREWARARARKNFAAGHVV